MRARSRYIEIPRRFEDVPGATYPSEQFPFEKIESSSRENAIDVIRDPKTTRLARDAEEWTPAGLSGR